MNLIDIDLCNADSFVPGVPHHMFAQLRAEAPVFFHPEPNGSGFWCITKYDDVVEVSLQHKIFSSGKKGALLVDHPEDRMAVQRMMMLNMDPPAHTKLRLLVNKGFTPRMVAQLEPRLRSITTEIIDAVAAAGECDFVTAIAAELPLHVILEMMGVPVEDRHKVFEWSNRLIGFDDRDYTSSFADGTAAAAEVYAYANSLAHQRREQPTSDLTSVLLHAEVDGERLTEIEFDLFFLLLVVAGNETTRNLISGGMLALIEHPQQRARLIANPALIGTAVEEMLRWVSPVMHFRRTALCDTEIRGHKIREGDKVVMWYISANRDTSHFSEPDHFDVGRTPNDHLAFGLGAHFCLGNNLARLEIRIMFEELLRRLPDIGLAGPVARLRSNFINGIKRMPVRFTPERMRRSA